MDAPIEGKYKKLVIRWMYKFFTFWFQFITNATVCSWKYLSKEDVNYYCEWLGPRELQEKE